MGIEMQKSRIRMVIGSAMFIFLLVVVFFQFQYSNYEKVSKRNATFAMENAQTTAEYIDRELQSALNQIEAYAYMINSANEKIDVTNSFLYRMEKESDFDYFRFTDAEGYNYTSTGEKSEAQDRDYYLNGMLGESGLSVVYNSRISGEAMLCFYAPLMVDNKPYGVIRGVYTADSFLRKLLSSTFFKYPVDTYICSQDGLIIAASDSALAEGFIGEYLMEKNYVDETYRARLERDIEKNMAENFTLKSSFATDNICVVPLSRGNLSLVKVFPKTVTEEIATESNRNNLTFLLILGGIIVAYFLYSIFRNRSYQNEIISENKSMRYLLKGTEDFTDKAVLVDMEKGVYEYLNDSLPLSPSVSKKGNYLDFYHLILSTIVEKKERTYMEEMIAPDKLSKLMSEHLEQNFSHVYEVNRNGERSWECIYVICIETKYKVPTKALFIRQDFTDIQEQQMHTEQVVKQAIEDAENANEAKSRFLANMSHEIRTPINAVLGMNAMIMREKNLDNIKAHAKDIESAGRSLLAIINDILDFSKIESGKMELTPVSYDVESLLHDSYNIIYPRMNEKDLTFNVVVNPKIPTTCYGDEIRIRQIMINLLTNAAKYTEEGTVTMTMDYRAVSSDTVKLIIEVKDTGIGISRENLRKLFRSFQRVDETRNRTIEGTGLGLSITKSFVEMMDGTISVESEYGTGSTFTVEIPQKVIDRTPIGEVDVYSVITEDEVYKEPFHAPEAKVLVVDDTEMNLRVFKGLVKDLQIQVDTARGGEEALKLLTENAYDLIFMDFRMPVMNGVEVLHSFKKKKLPINKETPFVILTANAMSGAREEYQSEGFDDYLSKPIKEELLVEMLLEYLPERLIILPRDFDKQENGSIEPPVITPQPEEEKKVKESEKPAVVLEKTADKAENLNISEETGLSYCADDMDLYKEMLGMYVEDAPQAEEELTSYLKEGDMSAYNIRVHALKSTSRTLGLMGMGDDAFALEKKSEEGDVEFVTQKHSELMKKLGKTVAYLKERYTL